MPPNEREIQAIIGFILSRGEWPEPFNAILIFIFELFRELNRIGLIINEIYY